MVGSYLGKRGGATRRRKGGLRPQNGSVGQRCHLPDEKKRERRAAAKERN